MLHRLIAYHSFVVRKKGITIILRILFRNVTNRETVGQYNTETFLRIKLLGRLERR